MSSVIVPVMAYYPEPNLDYSLIGNDFTLGQTFFEGGEPASESVLLAARQRLLAIFPTAIVDYEISTGKVNMAVPGVDRQKAEAYLDALRTDIRFAQLV